MQRNYHLDDGSHNASERALLGRLAQAGLRRHFAHGQLLHQQGDHELGFWLVTAGQVLIGKLAENGSTTGYKVLNAGELFGELAYFAGIERQVDATARGPCDVVWISHLCFERLLADEPGLTKLLLGSLARQLQQALASIDERRRCSSPVRLAALLLQLDKSGSGKVAASQQELADLLSISRVALVAALGQLAKTGLVLRGYRALTIVDRARLKHLAASAAAN